MRQDTYSSCHQAIFTPPLSAIFTHLAVRPSAVTDRSRERRGQDQMEHADDVDLSAHSVNAGGVLVYYQSHSASLLICQR